jgi:hypothetical protein
MTTTAMKNSLFKLISAGIDCPVVERMLKDESMADRFN